jgi:hypothetical protein
MAFIAPEVVFPVRSAPDRAQKRTLFALDPATGALVVRPEQRAKVEKALMREVRNIKFRLYCHFALLYIGKGLLQCGGSCVKLLCNLTRKFGKARRDRHL